MRLQFCAGLSALMLLSAGSGSGAAAAREQSLPVSAAARGDVEAYVAAVNDTGETAADVFRDKHSAPALLAAPRQVFVNFFTSQHRVLQGVDLLEIRMRDADTVVALMRGHLYGSLVGVTMNLDGTPEAKVVDFDPGPAPVWSPPSNERLSQADVGARALALAAKGCQAGVFSGAVLVARGSEVLAKTACGQANRRYEVLNTVKTKINLGSMDKMFTAVSAMQLVEAGKLSLDDSLDKYLDDTWLPKDISSKIKIRHLLTHTSGLGSFIDNDFTKSSRRDFVKLDDYKRLIHGETLAFEPGSSYAYSNTGMFLVGAVIEKVSGQDYFDYVREHVFKPAGMTDTGCWPMEQPVPDLAMGYAWAPASPYGWRENSFQYLYRGTPAGGGYSTVDDLYRFAIALEQDRLVKRRSRDFLWTDHPPNDYGAGFMITNSVAGPIVGHEGFFNGVSAQLEIYPDRGFIVAILGNQDWAAPGLGDAIRSLIASSAPSPSR